MDADMTTIQLLVNRQADAEAFSELLPSDYEIRDDPEIRDADLYLIEAHLLPEYETALRDRIDEAHPLFCPVIVVQEPETRSPPSLTVDSETELSVVDDILQAPVTQQRLRKRVESLLQRREQSEEMHEQLLELERMNQQRERIASVFAHDLRNPLQAADGRAKILQRENTDDALEGDIEALVQAIERIDNLTEDMTLLLQSDTPENEQTEIRFEELVRDAWKTTSGAEDGTTLETDGLDEMTVWGVRDRLLRVFENLFRNAIVHGGTPITIRVGALDDGFYVEDDGAGIPPEKRDEVFREGYSTRESENETGLGLSIIQNVIERHGWEITLTGSDDGGARFEVSIE
jgi:signal transduction histidine kinase